MAALANDREPEDDVEPDPDVDERVYLHGVRWEDYERLDQLRRESAVPRLTYIDGELELMSPSTSHEAIKTCIARLLEVYAEERGLVLNGIGSWTIKSKRKKTAAEPDECYSLGPIGLVPDIAIEVVWTSGGLSKLEVYRRLGVPEVWMWRKEKLEVYALRRTGSEPIPRSELIPELDLQHLLGFIDFGDQTGAARRYRAWLQDH